VQLPSTHRSPARVDAGQIELEATATPYAELNCCWLQCSTEHAWQCPAGYQLHAACQHTGCSCCCQGPLIALTWQLCRAQLLLLLDRGIKHKPVNGQTAAVAACSGTSAQHLPTSKTSLYLPLPTLRTTS
jgi:hypothetical protein